MTENLPPGEGEGDTLFYARWDGKQWTTPIDVLVSPLGAAEFPDLAVTPDGTLHAVWGTGGASSRLMYANAPACCADNPQAWSQPVSLGSPVNLTTTLIADAQGRLHVAFASLDSHHVVYRRSDDNGKSWPVWLDLPDGALLDDEFPAYPRLAVDDRGRVHAVWTMLPWPGRAVMYAHSENGGDTWNEPELIDSTIKTQYASIGYGPTLIDVEIHGKDEVHLIWDGAPTVERTHIWSSDGGNTWSKRSQLFPEITEVGRSGWNDMTFDSAGTLHAVSLGGPLHASWNGVQWSGSTDIAQTVYPGTGEWLRIAVSLGNQLHVVWVDKETEPFAVWYVRGDVPAAPPIAPQALPPIPEEPAGLTVLPTVTPSATATATPVRPVAQATRGIETRQSAVPPSAPSPMGAIVWGVVPCVALVGVVVFVRVRRRR